MTQERVTCWVSLFTQRQEQQVELTTELNRDVSTFNGLQSWQKASYEPISTWDENVIRIWIRYVDVDI